VIELIKATTLQIAIFASGEMTQPAGIVASMRAGAGEYVDSSAGSDALLEALTRFKQAHARVEKGLPTLTALEREIIRLLAEGNSSKEVASLLNLSTTTVETHRSNIMRKLSCHSIRDLVVYATKNNLIQIERAGFLEKGQWLNVSSISDVMELQPLQLKLSVVIVATNTEQRAQLQALVEGTKVARSVHACPNFPVASDDPVTQRVRAANPDVILVDIPVDKSQSALRAIELLHQEVPESAIFAIGRPSQAKVNVNAIRAGAREFIERPTTTADLLEAFARLTTRSPPPGLLS
jgi:DNA-binding NarL/FixJ family response regulator